MNVLIWFKRDLRVHDHAPLVMAAELGAVLPVFVVEPELWGQAEASARQWEFVAESLAALREDLAGLGAPLVVRVGDARQVLDGLCRRHRIGQIVSQAEPGTGWSEARNRRVADWARGAGIIWTELPPSGEAGSPLPAPALRGVSGVEPGLIPSARALKLAADPCPHRQSGGRDRGVALMESFLLRRGETYHTTRSCPLVAERASSRLSPHLAWGALSAREVAEATAARQAERPGGRWGAALSRFQTRLAARQAANTLQYREADPLLAPRARARETDAARLASWANGETGLPFLDACLRYLRATGWLNAPMRAMVTSVACWQLSLDGQATGAHLARMSTDYAPALLWPQVRLAAMGSPPGLWNPVQQGMALDQTGAFTRYWVPELAPVPDSFLQDPWRWPEARRFLGRRYPEPIVDLAASTRDARAELRQLRRSAGFAEPSGGFAHRSVNRSATRQRQTAQLLLPF